MEENKNIQTGQEVQKLCVQHEINRDTITAQVQPEQARNIHGIKSARKEKLKQAVRSAAMKVSRKKNKKYIIAKADTGNSFALESAELVHSSICAVGQTAGTIRTAVNRTGKAAGSIATAVKSGQPLIRSASVKDVGKVAGAVGGVLKNAVKDISTSLLKTQIDRSTVTDTGTEAIKQGITEVRHIENVRRTAVNTVRTSVRAGRSIKTMPRKTKAKVQQIRKNAQRTAKAAQKIGSAVMKFVTTKAGMIVILTVVLLLLLTVILSGLTTVITSAVCSLFTWLAPEDTAKMQTEIDVLNNYRAYIAEYVGQKQAEIDAVVDGFIVDTRKYEPFEPIEELNQFGNKDIEIENINFVLAILAVQKYRDLHGNIADFKPNFTKEEIQAVVEQFYTFDYQYVFAPCNDPFCQKEKKSEKVDAGTENERVLESTRFYCNTYHLWLYGEVINHNIEDVLKFYSFSDDELSLYMMYLAQINQMTGG